MPSVSDACRSIVFAFWYATFVYIFFTLFVSNVRIEILFYAAKVPLASDPSAKKSLRKAVLVMGENKRPVSTKVSLDHRQHRLICEKFNDALDANPGYTKSVAYAIIEAQILLLNGGTFV